LNIALSDVLRAFFVVFKLFAHCIKLFGFQAARNANKYQYLYLFVLVVKKVSRIHKNVMQQA